MTDDNKALNEVSFIVACILLMIRYMQPFMAVLSGLVTSIVIFAACLLAWSNLDTKIECVNDNTKCTGFKTNLWTAYVIIPLGLALSIMSAFLIPKMLLRNA